MNGDAAADPAECVRELNIDEVLTADGDDATLGLAGAVITSR